MRYCEAEKKEVLVTDLNKAFLNSDFSAQIRR
jgi:hypothetical protein